VFAWAGNKTGHLPQVELDLSLAEDNQDRSVQPNADMGAYTPIPVGRLGLFYKIYFKRMQYRPVPARVNPDMWIYPFFKQKTAIFERTV
jgi:hypothetical protein